MILIDRSNYHSHFTDEEIETPFPKVTLPGSGRVEIPLYHGSTDWGRHMGRLPFKGKPRPLPGTLSLTTLLRAMTKLGFTEQIQIGMSSSRGKNIPRLRVTGVAERSSRV